MLRAILNNSWRQHPTKHQLYGHLPPITKTIQVRRTRLAGHSWKNREELKSDVLLWTPTYGRAKPGRPARTCIQQLCEDTGCSPEDLPEAMNDREKWQEKIRDIHASGKTWWWWHLCSIRNSICVYLDLDTKEIQFNHFLSDLNQTSRYCLSYVRKDFRQGLSLSLSLSLYVCITVTLTVKMCQLSKAHPLSR